jgi:hypothetical protein
LPRRGQLGDDGAAGGVGSQLAVCTHHPIDGVEHPLFIGVVGKGAIEQVTQEVAVGVGSNRQRGETSGERQRATPSPLERRSVDERGGVDDTGAQEVDELVALQSPRGELEPGQGGTHGGRRNRRPTAGFREWHLRFIESRSERL